MSLRLHDLPPLDGEALWGSEPYSVDPKGRILLPAHIREKLGSPVMVICWPACRLLVLSLSRWDALAQEWSSDLEFQEFYAASARLCAVNSIGRIQLSRLHRDHADLSPGMDAVVAGVGSAAVISTQARWEYAFGLAQRAMQQRGPRLREVMR